MCFTRAYQEIPKYQHRDPVTSKVLLCDQCPPGTAVERHCSKEEPTVCAPCPEKRFAEQWHWGDSCQHCTSVCKERQIVRRECNSTHDRLCECIPGYHLVVEFCVRHTTCSPGFGVVVEDITLCEEAIFQFLTSPPLASVPVERLSESLPGRKVDWKSVERLKKNCSPQQQALHLLRLWREQNKDQDKLLSIIQGYHLCLVYIKTSVNHCERKVSRCANVKNLTLEDLLSLIESLPGEKVSEGDVRAMVRSCPSQRYILQLLHLWKIQNGGQDLAKALSHSLRKLNLKGARRPLLKILKRISRIISASSIHRMYEKMIVNMIQDNTCFKTKLYND
ncbi:tumor necrosis factor receptor superfamily member 11B-like protein [Labeo rohita]|uniref:Tumor necrosis factor receptor superfamily member 11B-like protein n=1 Tax=Labeo rohita TaxID=84645 RepID=A0A498MCR2_LABRO|nr:tumor necrosis factor receptor superfamily member 11B-like protein [Labeo rohita]